MDKITHIKVEEFGQVLDHVSIEHTDGSFTSMLKSTYETQLAANEAITEL